MQILKSGENGHPGRKNRVFSSFSSTGVASRQFKNRLAHEHFQKIRKGVSTVTMKQVEQSLLEQLRVADADIDVFRGLISDYIAM